jgi:hypothetical protein
VVLAVDGTVDAAATRSLRARTDVAADGRTTDARDPGGAHDLNPG